LEETTLYARQLKMFEYKVYIAECDGQ
jgi:hypothetical protein